MTTKNSLVQVSRVLHVQIAREALHERLVVHHTEMVTKCHQVGFVSCRKHLLLHFLRHVLRSIPDPHPSASGYRWVGRGLGRPPDCFGRKSFHVLKFSGVSGLRVASASFVEIT